MYRDTQATAVWRRIRPHWTQPWVPSTADELASACAILGPEALTDYCTTLGVDRTEILAFLETRFGRDELFHPAVRAEGRALFPTEQHVFKVLHRAIGSEFVYRTRVH